MKKRYLLIMLSLLLLIANFTYAYPPDNAAVIYYKLMGYFEDPAEAIWEQISNSSISTEPTSEEVKTFIEKYKENYVIKELKIASELKHCDWGLDISQGFALQFPRLGKMKRFTYLLLADGAIAASQGDIQTALDNNLTTRRMANHAPNDRLIGFLVSLSMNRKSDEALTHLLSTYPIDEKTLTEFKNELLWQSYRPKPIRHPFMIEKEMCLLEISKMTSERYKKLAFYDETDEQKKNNKQMLKLLEKDDPMFLERSVMYSEKHYDNIFSIIEKPYTQAYTEVGTTLEKARQDSLNGKDEAILTFLICPALAKCYNHGINWKTHYNATLTALDIYIIAAKTGKLPAELPKSTYIDHFSGKPFIYEITDDGFTLRCQQEDLAKKTTHEFSYKLPK